MSEIPQTTEPTSTDNRGQHLTLENDGSYDCSNQARLKRMREVCDENHMDHYKYTTRIGCNKTLHIVIVDDERKIFYCQLGKVGSTSFLEYFAETTGKQEGKIGVHLIRDLRTVGLNMSYDVPVSEVSTRYKDYTKIVLVRHPLQRVVSAYFQVLRKAKWLSSHDPMTLYEFLRNLTVGLVDYNCHWTRYHNQCKLCFVDYDYVLQTETIDGDILEIADVFEVPKITDKKLKAVLGHTKTRKGFSSESFRYDDILKDFQLQHPLYMERLLRLYREDMELFDYGWDIQKKKSLCRQSVNSRECCS